MGTNYYVVRELSGLKETIHLGKQAGGWCFYFRFNKDYCFDLNSAKELALSGQIIDEYNQEISFKDFWENTVIASQKQRSHYQYCKDNHPQIDYVYLIDGYTFIGNDFS